MAITIDQKKLTKQSIYNFIYYSEEPVSKPQIAEKLDLSLPTVYKNITELLEEGLIVNATIQKSTGGRPPVAYASNKDAFYVISVAVSDNRLRFYAADAWRKEICYQSVPIRSHNLEDIADQISETLPEIMKSHHLEENRMIGLGITFPGVISPDGKRIEFSPTLQIKNVDLSVLFDGIPVKCPITISNDSTAAGYVEQYAFPVHERNKTFAYLFLESGVGGAIFIDGKPYYGTNRRSGEFGHMQVGSDGLVCACGKKDCLEAYVGAGRFSKNLGITVESFFEEVKAGNKIYAALWKDGLRHLAIGINTIRRSFDCDIVIGGSMTEYLEDYMGYIKEELSRLDTFGDEVDYIHIGNSARRAVLVGLTNHLLTSHLENL